MQYKNFFLLFMFSIMFNVHAKQQSQVLLKKEKRCGWYINPTPNNVWLDDRDGEWVISEQGMGEAKGNYGVFFDKNQWVKTNRDYGYGCVCMIVNTSIDKETNEKRILEIFSVEELSLKKCQNDKNLKLP